MIYFARGVLRKGKTYSQDIYGRGVGSTNNKSFKIFVHSALLCRIRFNSHATRRQSSAGFSLIKMRAFFPGKSHLALSLSLSLGYASLAREAPRGQAIPEEISNAFSVPKVRARKG